MFHILAVDDDKNTRLYLQAVLEGVGYTVTTAKDGEDALDAMDREHIDLVVLDVMMPRMDGYEFTKTLRETDNNLPILMVSAKQLPVDKHKGFAAGTDDYITKPIDDEEMLFRIKALLRRAKIANERKIVIGDVVLDYDSLTVTRGDEVHELPQKEFLLLYKLLSYPGKIKSDFEKIKERTKERTSRTSLTLVFATFVFLILLSAIAMTALALYLLTKAGVLVDVEGDLRLGSVLGFMSLISLVIGGAIAFFSSRIPLRPINNLINKMNRLAAGDYKTRLEFGDIISAHPAIKEISASFNTLAEELENTELLRNDFINNFSHEFKTPIVSITGFAKLLAKGNLTEEQRAMYLKSIEEESMRLSSMATNVLNLTKVENQTILTDVSKFNLSEQVRSAVLLLEGKWTKKNIDLQLDFDEFEIEASEELLKQVWINLIDNAVKFVPRCGTVELEVIDIGDQLCVKISNTGSEIPPEKQEKIFNKFYQADESHATQGNGIGLAIVKRIVQLHNGNVAVSSGNGITAFTVTLPKRQ